MVLNIKKIEFGYEVQFLNLIYNIHQIQDEKDSTIINWVKDNKIYFVQNNKTNVLWCDEQLVWQIIIIHYYVNDHTDVQHIIKRMMQKFFNLGHLTPYHITRHERQQKNSSTTK